jgi:hypothetical protein
MIKPILKKHLFIVFLFVFSSNIFAVEPVLESPYTLWPITSDYGPRKVLPNVGTWNHKGIDFG